MSGLVLRLGREEEGWVFFFWVRWIWIRWSGMNFVCRGVYGLENEFFIFVYFKGFW